MLVARHDVRAEIDGIKREAGLEEESRIAVAHHRHVRRHRHVLAIVAQLVRLSQEHGIDRTLTFVLASPPSYCHGSWCTWSSPSIYAHEFHSESRQKARGAGGGLKFLGDGIPDYLDFLYFSFVVGTTAQTSDVEVTSRAMRRVVMVHGLLSFFFNTTVIALTVNLAAQLVQG